MPCDISIRRLERWEMDTAHAKWISNRLKDGAQPLVVNGELSGGVQQGSALISTLFNTWLGAGRKQNRY